MNLRRIPSAPALLAALSALLGAAGAARAQCTPNLIVAGDRAANDYFGNAMAMSATPSGPRLAIGAFLADAPAGANSGSVYMYGLSNGQFVQVDEIHANPNSILAGALFGASIGFSDPYMIVGAPNSSNGGALYFFERINSTWTQTSAWYNVQTGAQDGKSVALSGEYAIFGAPQFDFMDNPATPDTDAGFVDIYKRQPDGTWGYDTRIDEHDATGTHANQHLGDAVAISGNVAVCSAPNGRSMNGPPDTGFIKIYRKNAAAQWLPDPPANRLFAPTPAQGDHFGASVATDGTFVVVGAPEHDSTPAESGNKTDSGTVFVYKYVAGQWVLDQQLFSSDSTGYDQFGSSVSVAGERIIVASGGGPYNSGHKAYVFRRVNGVWTQEAVLRSPDAVIQNFASSVVTDGTHLIVGDTGWDGLNAVDCGAAYSFALPTVSDSCEGATPVFPMLGQSTVLAGCTLNASPSSAPISGCGVPNGGADAWYTWTPACSGSIVIDTFGSAFDTVLSVHTACPTPGNEHLIACNDDGFAPPQRDSLVSFSYNAGQTYLIRVTGYGGDQGNYILRINDFTPAPSNDEAPGAIAIGVGTTSFDTCTATTNGVSGCNQAFGKDVWFAYTAACTGTTTIDTCGSSFDTVLASYLGLGTPASPGSSLACNDDSGDAEGSPCQYQSRISFPTLQGFQYLIRVGGYTNVSGSASGHGVLNISCHISCPADFNQNGTLNVQDIFDFLGAWFAADPRANFNGVNGLSVQDIFDFLGAWFAGCP